ncbi:MAG TPA: hypothetical protein VFB06_11285 [Streptosporangiaceae bacterium]|nr:hypothetical protein [Streptosporangiaceae bacterium]
MSTDGPAPLFPAPGAVTRPVVVRLRLPGGVRSDDLEYFTEAVRRLVSAAGLRGGTVVIQPEAAVTLDAEGILAAVAEAERLADGLLVIDGADLGEPRGR